MDTTPTDKAPVWLGLAGAGAIIAFAALFLAAESERSVLYLALGGAAAGFAAARLGLFRSLDRSFRAHDRLFHGVAVAGVLILAGLFREDHYVLFLLATVLLYLVATLGLNVQLGYAGVLNFAGASFFGVGCYTAAVLTKATATPHLLILLAGGAAAAVIGCLLILPVLRTSGHYAALVTIAFALLFKTFLEVNDTLGGPQGLRVDGMTLLGWAFNDNLEIGGFELSFYLSYVLLSLVLATLAFVLTKRLERSWVGLNLDAIRLDETAAACFGLDIARWKITAFTMGNFLAGVAGALYGMMLGFIAPTNFTFGDSLILVSIVLLGGVGNPWGLALATGIVVVLPEKLQIIQEYRFLLYASVVILMLLFRPDGLLPRQLRAYVPGWGTR
ncbi:MAG: branched-chain amino acid ABC transporter permease [Deferrisomatales bacterium]